MARKTQKRIEILERRYLPREVRPNPLAIAVRRMFNLWGIEEGLFASDRPLDTEPSSDEWEKLARVQQERLLQNPTRRSRLTPSRDRSASNA